MGDKLKHRIVSSCIVLISGLGLWFLTNDMSLSCWLGFLLGMAAGFGKELYDKFRKNGTGFNWWDIAADVFGVGVGTILLIMIIHGILM